MIQIEQNINEMEWVQTKQGFPGDVMMKILRDEPKSGAKTILVKIPKGGHIEPHSHIGVVQHLILEGSYDYDGQAFPQGSFRILDRHADVHTISSATGAVILMTYDPIER
jgi:hypothetical protein